MAGVARPDKALRRFTFRPLAWATTRGSERNCRREPPETVRRHECATGCLKDRPSGIVDDGHCRDERRGSWRRGQRRRTAAQGMSGRRRMANGTAFRTGARLGRAGLPRARGSRKARRVRKGQYACRRCPLPEHGNYVDLWIVTARVRAACETAKRDGPPERPPRRPLSKPKPAMALSAVVRPSARAVPGATSAPARGERPRPRGGWNRRADRAPVPKRTGGRGKAFQRLFHEKTCAVTRAEGPCSRENPRLPTPLPPLSADRAPIFDHTNNRNFSNTRYIPHPIHARAPRLLSAHQS